MTLTRRQFLMSCGATLAIAGLPVVGRVLAQAGEQVRPDQITLTPALGEFVADPTGLRYTSPVMAPPRPCTHLLVRHQALLPAGATIALSVRVSADGQTWSAWLPLEENPDAWVPEDGPDVAWYTLLALDRRAAFWQVQAILVPNNAGSMPELRQIVVDSLDSGTALALPPMEAPLAPEGVVQQPPIISRSGWGCPDGQGSRRKVEYAPVTHLVIHHTADSNRLSSAETSWAARVRAIWSFHTFSRQWGDIGYNYLIDPNGVIYEGRAGGDNAVGIHDAVNYGSMGVSLIGTYTSTPPTAAAINALVQLLAWKASQRDINPFGAAVYQGCKSSPRCAPAHPDGVVDTITGHRIVTPPNPPIYGGTSCPGDATVALFPQIRARVLEAMNVEPMNISIALTGVAFERTTLRVNETLRVSLTVRNTGNVTLQGQEPGAFSYDFAQSFASAGFAKQRDRFRVTLGTPGWDAQFPGEPTSDNPWRWGLLSDLAPGQEQTITGMVRMSRVGTFTLRAGLVQEYVRYFAENVNPTEIQVLPADQPVILSPQTPDVTTYDAGLNPMAGVYALGQISTAQPFEMFSMPRGALIGNFVWDGTVTNWGTSGPLGANGAFIIDQTRPFLAPVDGTYTFRVTSDDGAWLMVNGQMVIAAGTTQTSATATTGTIDLPAGVHVLSVRFFRQSGNASAGYDVQGPGETEFRRVPDGLGDDAPRRGPVFTNYPNLAIAAEDRTGSGIAVIRWSWDDLEWSEHPGALLRSGRLQEGDYTLYYQAVARNGAVSPVRSVTFRVNLNAPQAELNYQSILPLVTK